jgi:hypothetical protein
MMAEHLRGTAGRPGELVDVERRRVRREDGVGPRDLREIGERRLLQIHVLEDRLDDDVHLIETVVRRGRRDERHRLVDLRRGHLALRPRHVVVPADRRESALQRRLIDVFQEHRDAGVRVGHRDAAAHRAGAEDRGAPDVLRRRALRDAGDFRRLALGKEHVPERLRFGRDDAARGELALAARSGFEPKRQRRLNRVHRGVRGGRAARHAPETGTRGVAGRGPVADVLGSDRQLAGPANLPGLRPGFRERDRLIKDRVGAGTPAIDDAIEDAGRERRRCRQRLPVGAHVEREPGAGQPRQPLRATGARDDAEEHLRLSDLGVLCRDAVVARHRHFEPASQRVPVDGRDEGLGRVLDALQEGMDARGPREGVVACLQLVEDPDVRPGDERRAGADEDDGFDGPVRACARDSVVQALPDGGTEGVDRRVVDSQDGHSVPDVVADEVGHLRLLTGSCSSRSPVTRWCARRPRRSSGR